MAAEKPEEGMQRIEVNMPAEVPAPAPAEETPAEPPAEEVPAEEAPAEEPPAEETPSEETPAEETPAEETTEEAPPETPAEEIPAEEPPKPAPANIPDDIKRVASFGHAAATAMQRNPALYKMYLQQLKTDGITLAPEDEALLVESAPEKKTAPAETYEAVVAKAKQMILDGREVEASDTLAKWHSDNANRELRASIESLKAEQVKTKAELEKERAEEKHRNAATIVKNSFRELVTKFPSLFMVDADPKSFTGIHSKDVEFLNAFYKNVEELGPKVSLDRAVKVTLVDLGRVLPKPAAKTGAPAAPLKPAAKPAAPKLTGMQAPLKPVDWKSGKQRVEVQVQVQK